MKFFVCLLALPAVLLLSLAAPVADRDLVALSDGRDALACPDGFNIALKPQHFIKSLNRREDRESVAADVKNYGLGPLKNFTWHLQMQVEEIRRSSLISPSSFPPTVNDHLTRQDRCDLSGQLPLESFSRLRHPGSSCKQHEYDRQFSRGRKLVQRRKEL